MENWDEQNLNSEWRKAFAGAEATPSEQVWKNIDARLMLAENASMKKSVVFYQRLAAASIGILFFVSGYAFWSNQSNEESRVANNLEKTATETKSNGVGETEQPVAIKEPTQEINVGVNSSESNFANKNLAVSSIENQEVSATQNGVMLTADIENQNTEAQIDKKETVFLANNSFNDHLDLQFALQKLNPALPKRVKPNDLGIAYRIADASPAIHKKKQKEAIDETAWAALGIAAGNFSQSASNLDLMQASNPKASFDLQNSATSGKTEKTKPGSSLSWSILGGKRLAKRWVLQGGLNYLNQSLTSNTSSVEVASPTALADRQLASAYAPENSSSVTYTTNSEINSTFQFISVPMLAGYMLVDHKLGVQLNGGISPDIFLKSVLMDKSSGEETVSRNGSSSTFKTVSISGLGGIEVSYQFLKHYRVSLVPGFRYALTAVYKENSLASTKPLAADIGLRFRYMF